MFLKGSLNISDDGVTQSVLLFCWTYSLCKCFYVDVLEAGSTSIFKLTVKGQNPTLLDTLVVLV
jgi:hypothetical protein